MASATLERPLVDRLPGSGPAVDHSDRTSLHTPDYKFGHRHRGRLLLRRWRACNHRVPTAGPAPHPGGEHENREAGDRRERDHHRPVLERAAAARPDDPRLERTLLLFLLELPADVARVELVDVELAVQAEVVRVRAEEALDVCLRGQDLELLVLQGAQVLAPDLRRLLDLGEVEPLPETSLAEAVADLEHRDPSLRQDVVLDVVEGQRDRSDQGEVEAEPAEDSPEPRRGPAARASDRPVQPPAGAPRELDRDDAEDRRDRDGEARMDEAQVVSVVRDQDPDRDRRDREQPEEEGERRSRVPRPLRVTA